MRNLESVAQKMSEVSSILVKWLIIVNEEGKVEKYHL